MYGRAIRLPSAAERRVGDTASRVDMLTRGLSAPVTVLVTGPRGATETRKLTVHELAAKLPPMTREELARLLDDVAAHGVQEPLKLYQGKVLDGRHRLAVAGQLGVPVTVTEFTGTEDDAAAYVLSANLVRRHLTAAQQALLAHELVAARAKAQAAKSLEDGRRRGGVHRQQLTDQVVSQLPSEPASKQITAEQPSRGPVTTYVHPEPAPRQPAGLWQDRASRMTGGVVSARSLQRIDAARLDEAPQTRERVMSGEIKSVVAASREAAKERGAPEIGPDLLGTYRALGKAAYNIRHAIECIKAGDLGTSGDTTMEQVMARLAEIRSLADQAADLLHQDGPQDAG